MCNAYNHPIGCPCGWGGDGHAGGNRGVLLVYPHYSNKSGTVKNYQPDYFSFTNPNATCPVCGSSVYYYQNCYGSKVYFDELGKPWTKHACLTNEKISSLKFEPKELIFRFDEYYLPKDILPIQLVKCEKEDVYYRILIKIKKIVNSFYVEEPLFVGDILFMEKRDDGNYLVGYRDNPIELKLYKKKEIQQ